LVRSSSDNKQFGSAKSSYSAEAPLAPTLSLDSLLLRFNEVIY